ELNEWQNPVVNLATKLTLLATTDDEPHEWVESDGIRGITYADLGHPELIAIAKVFSLAAWWYDAESKFRFASKNFRVFANAGESNALDSQDTTAITDYEARRSKFGTLSGSAGLWYDPHRVYANDSDLCIWYGVVQALPGSFAISSVEPAVELPVQYLMSPAIDYLERRSVDDPVIPFDHLILHEMLRPAFEEAFGCEASKTVAFLYVIRRFLYSNLRMPRLDYDDLTFKWEDEPMSFRNQILHHWSDVTSLGLLRSDKASWLAGLGREAEVVHDYDSSIPLLDEAEITGFVERFTWLDGEAVYDDQPRLFTKLSSKALVLDLVWLGDFLRHVLLQAGIASRESKNMKEATGPWLEKQAKSFFIRELSLDPESVLHQREVKDADGKEEIDLAFVVNRCLFVIDCKAMSKTADYVYGEFSVLRNRKTKQLEQLRQRNPARIRKIEAGLTRDVIRPVDFDCSFGLVCTSDVEYLTHEESELWTNGKPRVGTPNELLETINSVIQDASGVVSP
ncbi:MAG: NERD domain-containing protein, partial [Planctomycetota bacterium]